MEFSKQEEFRGGVGHNSVPHCTERKGIQFHCTPPVVQGALKSLLWHYNLKASVLWCSAFFMVQVSHLYMTTGKTTVLTIRRCVGKVLSLLFNMWSRFVISFLSRSKHLLISWLQSPSAVILVPRKIVCHCFHCFLSICHEVIEPDAMIFDF